MYAFFFSALDSPQFIDNRKVGKTRSKMPNTSTSAAGDDEEMGSEDTSDLEDAITEETDDSEEEEDSHSLSSKAWQEGTRGIVQRQDGT